MAIRDTLKANLDVALASTSVGVSAELPFNSAGEPLYTKNMKHVYLDEDNIAKTELISTLDNNDIVQTETTVTGYLAVDAKTQPTDVDTIVSSILNSRLSVTGQPTRECEMTTEIDDDVLIYTFNFNFITV
jgi:hypothetical protein